MGIDSVSLSTRTGLGSIYNQWKYAVNNKKTTDNFKTYLLSSQEHLNQLETLFTDYGHVSGACGDTFVKESIIELQDGRLLCLDPTEAQAYILDLNGVNSNSQQYNLTVIKPEDTSVSFSEQITNLISKITAQLGADGITTTKDGTGIDSNLLINTLSGNAKTQYCDEMGISDTSSTDTAYTSGKLKLFAGKGISDITTDQNEHEYYLAAFQALGIEFNSDNNTFATTFDAGGASFTASFNNTLNSISKIMEKGSTASDQDKLNLLQIIRKMSTIEYELLEKLNPGFTEALNTLIGDFQSRTYLDRNGNSTGLDTTISYETVMKEKLEAMNNDASSYLSAEDRKEVDKYLGWYIKGSDINSKITEDQYLNLDDNDRKGYSVITLANILDNGVAYGIDNNIIKKLHAAKNCMEMASSSVAYKTMSNAISNTVAHGVSSTTIENYKNTIKSKDTPDDILLAFLDASNATDGPEIISRILEDTTMVEKLKEACAKKGTLSILDKRTGESKTGILYDTKGIQDVRRYTVENILNHLEYQTKVYYSNKTDSTSSIKSNSAINSMEDGIYKAENGDSTDKTTSNVEDAKTESITEKILGWGGGGVGATIFVGGSIAKGTVETTAGAATKAASWLGHWAGASKFSFGAFGITLTATTVGASLGLKTGQAIIDANQDKFTNADGTFNEGKAGWFKAMTSLAGGSGGFALGGTSLLGLHSLWALTVTAVSSLAAWAIYEFA